MSIFNIFKQQPPPPPPFYKKQPVATATFIFAMVCTLILGPVGVIYNGISEELKRKVDNQTLILMIEKDRENITRQEGENDSQGKAILENQKAIQTILMQKQVTPVRFNAIKTLPAEYLVQYYTMKDPEAKIKYKKYLKERGFDISGLE